MKKVLKIIFFIIKRIVIRAGIVIAAVYLYVYTILMFLLNQVDNNKIEYHQILLVSLVIGAIALVVSFAVLLKNMIHKARKKGKDESLSLKEKIIKQLKIYIPFLIYLFCFINITTISIIDKTIDSKLVDNIKHIRTGMVVVIILAYFIAKKISDLKNKKLEQSAEKNQE